MTAPDPQVLGQILLLQSTLHVAPDEMHLGQQTCHTLRVVPGVASAVVLINDIGVASTSPAALPRLSGWTERPTEGPAPVPADSPVSACDFRDTLDVDSIPFEVGCRSYGRLLIEISDLESYSLYKPFLQNTANLIALMLESRRKDAELRDLNRELECRVQERTQDLIQANAKLELKNAALERFTYTVSHELKTPLVTIAGYLYMISESASNEKWKTIPKDIAVIERAVLTMRAALDGLLELSRLGNVLDVSQNVSLCEVVSEARSTIFPGDQPSDIVITIDPDLPVVRGDRIRLSEVFRNLLENAIKYRSNSTELRIAVGVRNSEDERVLFVRDNGIGISPQFHKRVFRLFEQLRPKCEGSGLGLSIVQTIVQLHGGRIWIESEGKDSGTAFLFTLPLAEESVSPRHAVAL